MLGILLAFGTLGVWALSDIVAKHALSRHSTLQLLFWGQFLGGVGILLIGLLVGEIKAITVESLGWMTLLALLNIGGMVLFYTSIRHKGVALSLPIVYSWSVPTIFLSYFFLHQVPSMFQGLGIITVIAGLFLVSVEPGHKRWIDRASLAAFFSMLSWGVFYFLVTTPSELYGEWWTGGAIKLLTAVLVIPFWLSEKTQEPQKNLRKLWSIGVIGICDALGLVAVSNALQLTSNTVVTGIDACTPAVVAAMGILFYKEKVSHTQGLGILLAVMGLVCLVL